MKSKFALTTFAAVAVLGLGLQQASATILIADDFGYADGELTVYDGTGANVSGGLWAPHSGTGFAPAVIVNSGQALLEISGSEDVNRSAGASNNGTDVWYYAAKLTFTDNTPNDPFLPSALGGTNVTTEYFMHLRDSAAFDFPARIYATSPTADPSAFAIGLSAGTGGMVTQSGDLAQGVEHTVVVKFDPNTGTATLWVDAAGEGDPSVSDTNAALIGVTADTLAMRQAFNGGFPAVGSSHTIAVNGVGLATSFDEAVAATMIPEPASLALIGLGGLALFRRR